MLFKWIHHILEPHCEHCLDERETNRICQSCETLKSQLTSANYREEQLLARILELTNPVKPEPRQIEVPQELKPRNVSWQVRRQMLEENDRAQAKVIAENRKQVSDIKAKVSVQELEKELGVEEAK